MKCNFFSRFRIVLYLAIIFLVSACSTQQQADRPANAFYTPPNWEQPIVKPVRPSPASQARETPEPAVTVPLINPKEKVEAVPEKDKMTGFASWYGPGFQGKATANGETYDQDKLTAAHKFLPMNAMVKVTNLENSRTVIVRINDRGPYKKERILDLSRRAALELDMLAEGTAKVALQIVKMPEEFDKQKGIQAYKQVVIQLAVFSTRERADDFKQHIQGKYPELNIIVDQPKQTSFHVVAGPFNTREEAAKIATRMKQEGINNFVRSYRK